MPPLPEIQAFIKSERSAIRRYRKVKCKTEDCDRWVNVKLFGKKSPKEYCDRCLRRAYQRKRHVWVERPATRPCFGCGTPVPQRQFGPGAPKKRCVTCRIGRERVLAQKRNMRRYLPGGDRAGRAGMLDYLTEKQRQRMERENKETELAWELHRQGYTIEQIARALHRSRANAQKALNRTPMSVMELARKNTPEGLTPDDGVVD